MKIVTFGELMMRLSPQGNDRFIQSDTFRIFHGGAEANVAVSLSEWGEHAVFVSKIPDHEIGQMSVNSLRRYGVDTSEIVRGGEKMGVYYAEKGASQRAGKVIYDRKNSAFALSTKGEYDWDRILDGADGFLVSGITPALGGELAEIAEEACRVARKKKVTVFCDLNYRNTLWSKEAARQVMTKLVRYVDVCITNVPQVDDVLAIKADSDAKLAEKLKQEFGFAYTAFTYRDSLSASDNVIYGMLYDGENFALSRKYPVHIVDRVGGGDAFTAGLIYSLKHDFTLQNSIEFATASDCLKHSVEGDYNFISLEEIQTLAGGDGSGRVRR